MYAVIDAVQQARVQVGEQLDVELLSAGPGDEVNFVPKLVVDGDRIVTERDPLEASCVKGRVIGLAKGPKIVGFTYKAKARGRAATGTVSGTRPSRSQRSTSPASERECDAKAPADSEDEPTAAVED